MSRVPRSSLFYFALVLVLGVVFWITWQGIESQGHGTDWTYSQLVDKAAEGAFAHWLRTTTIGKFFALPPDVPPAIVDLYRAAFRTMTADPHFQDLAAVEIGGDYTVMTPEDLGTVTADLAAMPESELAILRGLKQRYGVPLGGR